MLSEAKPTKRKEGDVRQLTAGMLELRWQIGKCIGRGTFGSVHMGINLQTKEVLALKRIEIPSNSATEQMALQKDMQREWDIISELNNPHLVHYFGIELHKVRCCTNLHASTGCPHSPVLHCIECLHHSNSAPCVVLWVLIYA